MALSEEQKQNLNNWFGVDLDEIGEANYTVWNQLANGAPIGVQVEGAQLFSTELSGKLIVLGIHNGETVTFSEDCELVEGYGL